MWLHLAAVAQRLSPLEDRLPLLPLLAPGWDMGEVALRPTQKGAGPTEEEPSAQRRDSGQPVGQNDRGGRQRAWLRRGQEGQRKKASLTGGHTGVGARSEGPQRQRHRPRRYQAPPRIIVARCPPAPLSPVAGRRLYRPREGRRLGG